MATSKHEAALDELFRSDEEWEAVVRAIQGEAFTWKCESFPHHIAEDILCAVLRTLPERLLSDNPGDQHA